MFTMARIKGSEGLSDIYQTFIIFRDGKEIGNLRYAYRPKNAGGRAWRVTLTGAAECSMDVVSYHSTKAAGLEWIKAYKFRR
jgi:hypothetical protein